MALECFASEKRDVFKPIPQEPRELWVINSARAFIRQAGINWLPVDPFKIAEKHGWPIITAGQHSRVSRVPRHLVINGADSNLHYCNGIYKIVYNEQAHKPRITFTIAHEIGHIVLRHLEEFVQTRISYGGLPDPEYQVLEREAEIFAAELLMPLPVLRSLRPDSPADIAQICGVSKSTALIRYGELQRSFAYDDLDDDYWMQAQFSWFSTSVAVCINKTDNLHVKKTLHQKLLASTAQMLSLIKMASVNDYGRCCKCDYPGITSKATFCRLCGLFLIENCNPGHDECKACRNDEIAMSSRNSGNAEHCERCGRKTFMTFLGLLTTREIVEQAMAEMQGVPVQDCEREGLSTHDICFFKPQILQEKLPQYCFTYE